jgi:two-component system phosphate regulon sensor histidine kinase PhoR
MHPLRVLLLASVVAAATVATAFGFVLHRLGVPQAETMVIAFIVFAVFIGPWAGVTAWALRRASDLDLLIEKTRDVVEGRDAQSITMRAFHGELDDLARAIEELRVAMLRERAWSEEQRVTMQQIVASLGEGLLALSPRGRVVLANQRVAEMFGASGDLLGKPILEAVRNKSLHAAFESSLHGEASSERITIGAKGEERQIEIRVFPVASSSEVAAVALFIDMTQIERLQRVRKDFLDDISHEVRTPLAGLRSAVETFDQGGLRPEQEEQLRHVMLRQLTRIERLVKDLSELNRIESGELVLERREVELRELLTEISDDFRERTSQPAMAITITGEARVSVDPARVQQIFSNLFDNAWKHGGGRGEVLVEIGQEDGEAVVRVSDQGEGIPAHELQRIFNRFYRVDKSRSQNVPGTGLGLAITKHLVLLHGGSIRAFNRPSGGATFEVRLPA